VKIKLPPKYDFNPEYEPRCYWRFDRFISRLSGRRHHFGIPTRFDFTTDACLTQPIKKSDLRPNDKLFDQPKPKSASKKKKTKPKAKTRLQKTDSVAYNAKPAKKTRKRIKRK